MWTSHNLRSNNQYNIINISWEWHWKLEHTVELEVELETIKQKVATDLYDYNYKLNKNFTWQPISLVTLIDF